LVRSRRFGFAKVAIRISRLSTRPQIAYSFCSESLALSLKISAAISQ